MKIAIYGAGCYGQYIYNEIINSEYSKVSVAFWIDNFIVEKERCGLPVYTEKEFLAYKSDEVDAVVIAVNNRKKRWIQQEITTALLQQGYDRIYLTVPDVYLLRVPVLNEEGYLCTWIKSYKEIKPTTDMILSLVTNNCNLNCKRCFHLSNLVKENDFLDLDTFENYLKQMKKKFRDILRFQLLGGEPLLNPQLDLYIALTRKYFPGTKIEIVTNGLLIPKMPAKLIETMEQCNAFFWISQYPPTRKIMEQIVDLLEKERIHYEFSPSRMEFRRWISFKEENGEESFSKWARSDCMCHTIDEGRIYMCPCIPKLYTMRDYFDIHIEEEEAINSSVDLMSDEVDGWDILQYFKQSTPLCRFCSSKGVMEPWETGHPVKEDWIADEN